VSTYKSGRGRIGPKTRYALQNLQAYGQTWAGGASRDIREELPSKLSPGTPRAGLPVDRPRRAGFALLAGAAILVWAMM